MQLLSLNCPNCSGIIELYADRKFGECMYCGQKVMIDNDSVRNVSGSDISQYDKLFEDGVFSIKNDDYAELETIYEKLLGMDDNNPHGWFFKGCCSLCVMSDPDYFADYATGMRSVRSCWSRAIDHLDSEYYLDDYSEMIGYAMASYCTEYQNDDSLELFNAVSDLGDRIDRKFNIDYKSDMFHHVFRGASEYLKTVGEDERDSYCLEIFILNMIALDPDFKSILNKIKDVNDYCDATGDGLYCSEALYALEGSFKANTKDISDEKRLSLSSRWTGELLIDQLGPYWDDLFSFEEQNSGLFKKLIKRNSGTIDDMADAYVIAYLDGPQ